MKQTVIEAVRQYIAKHHLLRPEALYLVALSGGADSVALLLILRQLGYRLEAVHCNFKLRAEESDSDEQFCADLCVRLDIKLHRVHFDTRFYASQHHVSIEMAARELRYHYFARLANEIKAEGICVAHHQDDSVETVIMNLIRGTGIQGLLGIQPVNGLIIRPLLCVTRSDIVGYLNALEQPFVTDSTNLETDAVRNKIRLQILPQMEQINPATKQNIAHMSAILAPVAEVYQQVIGEDAAQLVEQRQGLGGLETYERISIEALMKARQPHDTLFHILTRSGFQPAQVEQVWENMHASTGKMYESATHELVFDRGFLLMSPRQAEPSLDYSFSIEGVYHLGECLKVELSTCDADTSEVSREPLVATLDADLVSFPLHLRLVAQGDRFQPFGMKGMKLVSDFLTDQKVPLILKRRQMLIEDAKGRILWLVGHRTDNRFRVSPSTRRLLVLSLNGICPDSLCRPPLPPPVGAIRPPLTPPVGAIRPPLTPPVGGG